MRKQKVIFLLLFWMCLCFSISSQVIINPVISCAPAQINVSCPPGTITWNWGDGSPNDNFSSGSHIYATAGSYVINYTGPGGPVVQTIVVQANNLTAGLTFTAAASGCLPRVTNFSGSSSGANVSYFWNFGDLTSGSGATPTHAYGSPGVFNATLTVTDAALCTATVTAGPINVSGPHNLVINANPGFASCVAPFNSVFTASNSVSGSPLGGGLTYGWNFGNGQTPVGPTTGTITFAQGVYVATLTATDNNNCTNTITSVISVVQPTVSITAPTITCIKPEAPLPGVISVTIQSSEPLVTVDLGNGNPPFQVPPGGSPTFTFPCYTTPGIKTISVTAASGTCIATAIHTLMVEEIVPQFVTSAPFFTCNPVMIKNYVNQTSVNSTATLSYSWKVRGFNGLLDASNSSTVTNPTFTFVQGSTNPYTIFGTYRVDVTLIVQSSSGCLAEIVHTYDSIRRPTAWFNMNKRQGCAPLTVNLRDSSDVSNIYPIQSYTWSNGANPPTYSFGVIPPPNVNPTFVYNVTGTYSPSYTIATAGGCGDVSFTETVIVVNPSNLAIAFPNNLSVCAGVPVSFTLSATPATSLISHWHLESDNGYYSNCISSPVTNWPFTHLGVQSVTLSGSDHGCKTDLLPAQVITVNGPVGKFTYRTNCNAKKSVNFYPYLQNATTATLDYGDGPPEQLVGNANAAVSFTKTHVYGATGDYVAILTSYNAVTGCSFTHSMTVTVREINADFVFAKDVICLGTYPTFSATSSTDVLVDCGRGYTWFVDNLPPEQTDQAVFTYTPPLTTVGVHTVKLLVKDINSCTSSLTKTMRVASPVVDFGFNANPACMNANPVQINNLTLQTPDAVNNYTVIFGDGMAPNAVLSSANQWPQYNSYQIYAASQIFTVTVRGQDVIGCLSVVDHTLKVNRPLAFLSPPVINTCIGLPVTLYALGSLTNTLNYNDGSAILVDASGASSYVHTFTASGSYQPSLTVLDDGFCTASATATINVQSYPSADFIFCDAIDTSIVADVFCTPANVKFKSTGVATDTFSPIYNYGWSLSGNNTVPPSQWYATGFFNTPGVHTVTLTASTTNGCSSSVTHTLSVLSITAVPHIDKPKICIGETIHLSLSDTTSIQFWNWSVFGGTGPDIFASASPSSSYPYTFTLFPTPFGTTDITLYYAAGKGLTGNCDNIAKIQVQVVQVESDFIRNLELNPSDFEHCLGIPDKFTNKGKVNNSLALTGMNFLWSFGNGATSTVQSATYTYPEPGVYTVSLSISDPAAGCANVAAKSMTIDPLPTVTISATDSVCKYSAFTLYSNGSPEITEYNWSPAAGLVDPHAPTTSATVNTSTTYSLAVVNKYSCKGNSSNQAFVYIQQPPTTRNWDTTIIVGQLTNLNTNQGAGFTYSWSPLTDLSCSSCPYPTSSSTVNITYSVEVQDPMSCFRVTSVYTVQVDPQTSVDVPTAFTPNGDGVNDVIYVDGWGIKRLIYFRIFNRWGQLLFESNDIKLGWNGIYNGVPQNMETYIYQVSVETYVPGKNMEKTSSFRLIR